VTARRRLAAAALAALASLALAGCGAARPIENRAIVLALGVDPTGAAGPGADSALAWTFAFPNVTATASNIAGLTPTNDLFLVHVVAPDFASAVTRLQDRLSREPYLGDLESVALNLALDGATARTIVSDVNQDAVIPTSFMLVATPAATSRLLSLPTRQEIVPRYFLGTYFTCTWCHSFDWRVPGWEWWSRSLSPGAAPFAPILVPTATNLAWAGVAVYPERGKALVMAPDVAAGLAYVAGRVTADAFTTAAGGRQVSVVRLSSWSRASARLVGGAVDADLRIAVHGTLTSPPVAAPADTLCVARTLLARHVLDHVVAAVAWADAHRVDPFALTRAALLRRPALAYALAPGVDYWRPLRARVTVSTQIDSAGVGR
jgi:hypothetical protein